MATTLRNCVVDDDDVGPGLPGFGDPAAAAPGDLGILHHAKSRAGSHISATADGRYAPTDVASVDPTFCDVRRIMPMSVPLCLRAAATSEEGGDCSSPSLKDAPPAKSACESLAAGLRLRSRCFISECEEDGGERSVDVEARRCMPPSLKMCTVSEAEVTQRREEAVLKDMLKIRAGMEPRRNWYSLSAFGTEKTRMIVPLSEAVARRVPVLLMVMHDRGVL